MFHSWLALTAKRFPTSLRQCQSSEGRRLVRDGLREHGLAGARRPVEQDTCAGGLWPCTENITQNVGALGSVQDMQTCIVHHR